MQGPGVGLSLSAFRGGPTFPSMFIGAALGIAASGLPGMNLAAGIGMGIGAMCAAMLRLLLTSTLLAVVLMGVDGVAVTPQVIVAVVVAFVISTVLPVPVRKSQNPVPRNPRPAATSSAVLDYRRSSSRQSRRSCRAGTSRAGSRLLSRASWRPPRCRLVVQATGR